MDDDDPLRTFAANLRAERVARGLTQESVATAAGMDMSYYGRLERAVVDPSVRTVARVATALGVTPSRLMEGVERRD